MIKNISVSICMITFNQQEYIKKAIDSVLSQKVDFIYELLIFDDCSEDNTQNIIKWFIVNHPKGKMIKYFRQSSNQGVIKNFVSALSNCSGKYIALCEGDDFWTNPNKLNLQVEFLDKNPSYVLTHHPVNVLFPDGSIEEDYLVKGKVDKTITNIYDIVTLGNYIHTPSVVFRNCIQNFPSEIFESPLGDYFLYVLLGQKGLFKKIEINMACYRFGVGIHSRKSDEKINDSFIKTRELLVEVLQDKALKTILKNRIALAKYSINASFYNSKDKAEFISKSFSIKEILKSILYKINRFIFKYQ